MSQWWYGQSVDVTQGSKLVKVNSGEDLGYFGSDGEGSAYLKLAGQEPVQAIRFVIDTNGDRFIELHNEWAGDSDTGRRAQAFKVMPDFQDTHRRMLDVIAASQGVTDDVVSKIGTVLTSTDESVVIETPEGDVQVVPYGKLAAMLQEQIDYFDVSELNIPGPTNPQNNITLFIPDSLRAQVEYATQGKNTVLYNANGDPSIMVPIYKFSYEDLGFAGNHFGTGVATAFLKGGVEKSEIFIGAFQARRHNGQAVSLPTLDPTTSINFDNAKAACVANGPGWHLISEHEWAAIELWCMANGFEPRGNTNYGRAHDANNEVARRIDGGIAGDASGTARILNGTGPSAWRHDNSPFGIADLVGNTWEWADQLKTVDGRIICTEDNDFDADESLWVPQPDYLANEGGTLTLSNSPNAVDANINSSTWGSVAKAPDYAESLLMQRLMMSPAGVIPQGRLYANTSGERFPSRGGNWNNGSHAGLAARHLNNPRTGTTASVGFRPAFVA